MANSFNCKTQLTTKHGTYQIYNLEKLTQHPDLQQHDLGRLPFSLKILLENLLRTEDGVTVRKQDILSILNWQANIEPEDEISFTPARVILQDFTGVPAIVDLAAMREAMQDLGGNPDAINPLSPVELVIDHSVMVDDFGNKNALHNNTHLEVERNRERYIFLRWGQENFANFRVVPPGTGIVHQVNLEYLARVVFTQSNVQNNIASGETFTETLAYPDTLVGTDSHTTMINGLGVLGWGVGGIEAEAAMLGQAITMLIPQVVGFKLSGQLASGTTATDLVLVIVEMLRKKGVVGKFVEFYGDGLDQLPLADRATIANMAPEYGATCGIFPVDKETIAYLKLSGRDAETIELVEAYYTAQGMFRTTGCFEATYSDTLHLDLSTVVPCIAGPKRPQDKVLLSVAKSSYAKILESENKDLTKQAAITINGQKAVVKNGMVAIAAITSCTNTSNPDVMIAAGLLAKAAVEQGLTIKPWVKSSLAPGSQVVTDYLIKADLQQDLDSLGFNTVGYGCTTCIGNSGPLPVEVSNVIKQDGITAVAVLSGNRNFEGRIHPEVQHAYLASPPLVVAYALAGTMDIDFENEPIGINHHGRAIFLQDIWPSRKVIQDTVGKVIQASMFNKRYQSVFVGDAEWRDLPIPKGKLYAWDNTSTYVKKPVFFNNITNNPVAIININNAYVLLKLGDSVTTDHISPAGSISETSPAGKYLLAAGVKKAEFNSYGSRRGNHEVMIRGTFANNRLHNKLVPGSEGNWTIHLPSGEKTSVFDAAMRYQQQQQPLIILAGKEYGSGSSRDWAAKGTLLLGVRAVIAESFERIHRSNLIGMGILPLQFLVNETADSLNLTGTETFSIDLAGLEPKTNVTVSVNSTDSSPKQQKSFQAIVRIDTPKEMEYYANGGILPYVLRQLAKN